MLLQSEVGRGWVEQVARLYLIVNGRAPDAGGLAAYAGHMRGGKTLLELAAEFVTGDEFLRRVDGGDAAATLLERVPGAQGSVAGETLVELAARLVVSDAAMVGLPLLPALYPDGVPVEDGEGYRVWLAEWVFRGVVGVAEGVGVSFVLLAVGEGVGLEATMRSVLAQGAGVEVVVVGRSRFGEGVRRVAGDARVRLVRAPFWCGVAGMFNWGLARCAGQFVAVVAAGDQVAEGAVPAVMGVAGEADVVVLDDDALDAEGRRCRPRMGGEWDADRVMAGGCPGWVVVRRALLRRVGGMRRQEGREEWGMLLRAARQVGTRVVHVAGVFLSRRGVERGVERGAVAGDRAVVQGLLQEKGCRVLLEAGRLRVVYPLPRQAPLVSVVIPTRDRGDLLRRCVAGLLERTEYPALEVVIVDNGSVEAEAVALLERLAGDRRVRVVKCPGEFNWSALNNAGVREMRGEVAVLLNNDTDVVEAGWLREMVSQAMRPGVGVVGAKLLYADGRVQHAGVVLGRDGVALHVGRFMGGDAPGYLQELVVTREVSALTGACLAVRREVYAAAGGCEERLPITWNDVDFCLRVRALGLRAIWTPHARVMHLEQASRGSDDGPERRAMYLQAQGFMRERWGAALLDDAFLNPNLMASETGPRLAVR